MKILFLATNLFLASVVIAGGFDKSQSVKAYVDAKKLDNDKNFDLIKAFETFLDGKEIEELGYVIEKVVGYSDNGVIVHAANKKSEIFVITIAEKRGETCDRQHTDMEMYKDLKEKFKVTGVLQMSETEVGIN